MYICVCALTHVKERYVSRKDAKSGTVGKNNLNTGAVQTTSSAHEAGQPAASRRIQSGGLLMQGFWSFTGLSPSIRLPSHLEMYVYFGSAGNSSHPRGAGSVVGRAVCNADT